jgi:hypothetical protein
MTTPAPPTVTDGDAVLFEGRLYRFQVGASSCASTRHRHDEPHADGSVGAEPHHHHGPGCADTPRQATLYPLWDTAERHAHDFTADGTCACGATRAEVVVRPGGKRLMAYQMPADAAHPDGWSYERLEAHA